MVNEESFTLTEIGKNENENEITNLLLNKYTNISKYYVSRCICSISFLN